MRPDVLFTLVVSICLFLPMLIFGIYWFYMYEMRTKNDNKNSTKVLKKMANEKRSTEKKSLEKAIGKHKITFDSVYEALKPDLYPEEK